MVRERIVFAPEWDFQKQKPAAVGWSRYSMKLTYAFHFEYPKLRDSITAVQVKYPKKKLCCNLVSIMVFNILASKILVKINN